MHKVLPVIISSALVLTACPVMGQIAAGLDDDVRAGVDQPDRTSHGRDLPVDFRAGGRFEDAGRGDDRLSTTLLGKLEANGEPRLAVRWDGPAGALLDVWVDFDGDGVVGSEEMVVEGRSLEPGIEVVDLEVADAAFEVSQPRLSCRTRRHLSPGMRSGSVKTPTVEDNSSWGWQPGFHFDGLDGHPNAFAVFDDGSGPNLFVGGSFQVAGEVRANGIAKWDGSRWQSLPGSDYSGVSGYVSALAVFDDGTGEALYVGGHFSSAGGYSGPHGIAKWDGSEWSALGELSVFEVGGSVSAMTTFDDGTGEALFVAGGFDTAAGSTVNNVARWDGTSWTGLQGGTSGGVSVLAVFDDGGGQALYAGGNFVNAGGVTAKGIAKWDGSEWSNLSGPSGTGFDSTSVLALAVFDDGGGEALFAGGDFSWAGGVEVNRVAKWDGTMWSALPGTLEPGVKWGVMTLAVFDDGGGEDLYVGGFLEAAGGEPVSNIVKWDGAEWSSVDGPSGAGTSDAVLCLQPFDDGAGSKLIVGGEFSTAGGVASNRIATWDGTDWASLSPLTGNGVDGQIFDFATFDDGTGEALFVGGGGYGGLNIAGGVEVNNIAKWDGSWSPLTGLAGVGVEYSSVTALTVFDDGTGASLYVGGLYDLAGGEWISYIAEWDGASWSPLIGPTGLGLNHSVADLVVYDDGTGAALYAGGSFSQAGESSAGRVAGWDGTDWFALSGSAGQGLDGTANALVVHDDGSGPALFVGGDFGSAGGVVANNIAKWDGSEWWALSGPSGTGTDGTVYALAEYDDGDGPELYVGGTFSEAGGLGLSCCMAQWDGSQWSIPVGDTGSSLDLGVRSMKVFDDGNGDALYVGGFFSRADWKVVNGVARWDGKEWTPLESPLDIGVDEAVYALESFDDGTGPALFAGGNFTTAGGLTSSRIAKWTRGDLVFADGFEGLTGFLPGDTSRWDESVGEVP